jgi:hypothetical protein
VYRMRRVTGMAALVMPGYVVLGCALLGVSMNLSKACLVLGLISIPLSIFLWVVSPNVAGSQFEVIADAGLRSALADAHAERWGIFVGLWAPTLIALSCAFKAPSSK